MTSLLDILNEDIASEEFNSLRDDPKKIDAALENAETISLGPRVLSKLKLTPPGVRTFLEEEFGKENVIMTDSVNNNALIRQGDKVYSLEDESVKGASTTDALLGSVLAVVNPALAPLATPGGREATKDLLDILPDVAEGGLAEGVAMGGAGLGLAVAGGHPAGAAVGRGLGGAAGGAIARGVRQGVSALAGGEDFETQEGADFDIGIAAGLEAAFPAVAAGAHRVGRRLLPSVASRADEVRRLAQKIGKEKLPGGRTVKEAIEEAPGEVVEGLPAQSMAERAPSIPGVQREAEIGKAFPEVAFEHRAKQAAAGAKMIQKTLDELGPRADDFARRLNKAGVLDKDVGATAAAEMMISPDIAARAPSAAGMWSLFAPTNAKQLREVMKPLNAEQRKTFTALGARLRSLHGGRRRAQEVSSMAGESLATEAITPGVAGRAAPTGLGPTDAAAAAAAKPIRDLWFKIKTPKHLAVLIMDPDSGPLIREIAQPSKAGTQKEIERYVLRQTQRLAKLPVYRYITEESE